MSIPFPPPPGDDAIQSQDVAAQPQDDSSQSHEMAGIVLPPRTTSVRASIVSFALFGGGTASIACGLIAGVIGWLVMPVDVVPFPSSDRFNVYTSGERLMIWPFAMTLLVAPFMFLVFGFAASAQVIAESIRRGPKRNDELSRASE